MSTEQEGSPEGWPEALHRLEAHAERAEAVIRGMAGSVVDIEPWAAPADIGPLPEEFIPRARLLLARQQQLMALVPAVLAENRRQQKVADKVSDATAGPAAPVYLDVTA